MRTTKALPTLSDDGRYLAYVSNLKRKPRRDLWDLVAGRTTAVTTSPQDQSHPLFTAHGSRIAFAEYRTGTAFRVFSQAVPEGIAQLVAEPADARFDQLTDDGRYVTWHGGSEPVIRVLDLTTNTKAIILRAQPH